MFYLTVTVERTLQVSVDLCSENSKLNYKTESRDFDQAMKQASRELRPNLRTK